MVPDVSVRVPLAGIAPLANGEYVKTAASAANAMARTSLAPALPLAGACILPPGTKVGCLTLDAFSAETGVSYPDKRMAQTRANSIDRSVKSPSIESNRFVAGN